MNNVNPKLVKCIQGPFSGEMRTVTSLQNVRGGQYVFDKTVTHAESDHCLLDVYRWKPFTDKQQAQNDELDKFRA